MRKRAGKEVKVNQAFSGEMKSVADETAPVTFVHRNVDLRTHSWEATEKMNSKFRSTSQTFTDFTGSQTINRL